MLLTLNPQIHRVCEWPFLRSMRRRFPRVANLLVGYFHARERTWVVARWANRLAGVVDEMLVSPDPAAFTTEDVDELTFMLDPRRVATYKQWAQAQVSDKLASDRANADHCQQLQDIKRFMTKRMPGLQKEVPGTHPDLTELAIASEGS